MTQSTILPDDWQSFDTLAQSLDDLEETAVSVESPHADLKSLQFIRVDDEAMQVTEIEEEGEGRTFQVLRAQSSTALAAHESGAPVFLRKDAWHTGLWSAQWAARPR